MTVLPATRPPKETPVATNAESIAKQTQAVATVDDFLWQISVDKYHQMIKAGILTDDAPVELLEGLLVQKMSKNPPHRFVTGLIRQIVGQLVPSGWYVDAQEPITTSDSEPEPDISVIRGSRFDYIHHHPTPESTALIIEVADATLRRDRGRKKRLYARTGIPIYWIVNLIDLAVEVYSEPDSHSDKPDYRQRRLYRGTDQIPVIVDGTEVGQITVHEILPPQLANQSEG